MDRKDKMKIRKMHAEGARTHRIAREMGLKNSDVEEVLSEKGIGNQAKFLIGAALVLIALAFTVEPILMKRAHTNKSAAQSSSVEDDAQIINQLGMVTHSFLSKREDVTPPVSWEDMKTDNLSGIIPYMTQMRGWFGEVLEKSQEIPAAKGLYEDFRHLVIAYYSLPGKQGNGRVILVKSEDVDALQDPNAFRIMLYSRDYPIPEVPESTIVYANEMGFLLIRCEDYSKEWFESMVIHEMLHAKKYREGAASSNAEAFSDEFIKEELQAHGLQREFLDRVSQGAYFKRLREVVDAKNAPTLRAAWALLTPGDLEKIDAVWGRASRYESQVRTMQYMFDFSHFWLAKRYKGEDLLKRDIDAYRTLSDLRYAK